MSVDTNLTVTELETKPGLILNNIDRPFEACTSEVWPFCEVAGVVVEKPHDGTVKYWFSYDCLWFDHSVHRLSCNWNVVTVHSCSVILTMYRSTLFVILCGLPEFIAW